MNWNKWIRQFHRWVAIVFTLTVIANFVALAQSGGDAAALGHLLPAATARLAHAHRPVHVRAAICRQVARDLAGLIGRAQARRMRFTLLQPLYGTLESVCAPILLSRNDNTRL